jgi:WD40 repeat protein
MASVDGEGGLSATALSECQLEAADSIHESSVLLEEHTSWHVNAPLLYDHFLNVTLESPALCVAWLPDVEEQLPRLAFGTNRDDQQNEVIVCEFHADGEDFIEKNPWRSWRCDIGESVGFGLKPKEGHPAPLRTIARLRHPTEVNRVAPCPHRPQLLATKSATGAVLLFDYERKREPNVEADPDATFVAPGAALVDGFALSWSSVSRHSLVSGGNDGRCCLWDVNVASKTALLHDFAAHDGALCDAAFSRHSEGLLATVGDDRALHLWDLRAPLGGQRKRSSLAAAGEGEVLTVDWSHHCQHSLASAGKDFQVRIWDMRSLRTPVKSLPGHTGDCVVVRWAPPSESQSPNILASCSMDKTIIIWD